VSATIAAVPRRKAQPKSKLERLRALPWIAVVQGAVVISRRWRALSAKDRARLGRLARASQGRPSNLSGKERAELRALARKLDPVGLGRELLALGGRSGRRGRRRRGTRA
jgi:hypothetical protein